jgi:hypothetical protein
MGGLAFGGDPFQTNGGFDVFLACGGKLSRPVVVGNVLGSLVFLCAIPH